MTLLRAPCHGTNITLSWDLSTYKLLYVYSETAISLFFAAIVDILVESYLLFILLYFTILHKRVMSSALSK